MNLGLHGGSYLGLDTGLYEGLSATGIRNLYCPEYAAVINRAINLGYKLPSGPMRFLQDRATRKLIASGLWRKFDLLYIFRNDAGLHFSTLNFKNPTKFQANTSGITAGWVDRLGMYGDATIESGNNDFTGGWIANQHAVNFSQNNAGVVWSVDAYPITGASVFAEAASGLNDRIYNYTLDATIGVMLNTATGSVVATPASSNFLGNYQMGRIASGTQTLDVNGATLLSSAATSTGLAASQLYMLGYQSTTASASPFSRNNFGNPMTYFGIGSKFSTQEFATLSAIISEYEDAILYNVCAYTSGNYTVPAGISQLKIECFGAGGAGRGYLSATQTTTGAGGGGGAYASSVVSVIPGQVIAFTIGAGGVGGTGTGGTGGDTSWNSGQVLAKGGGGGATNGVGGTGGLASASTGDVKFNGGTGGAGGTVLAASAGTGASGGSSIMNGNNGLAGQSVLTITIRAITSPLGPQCPGSGLSSSNDSNGYQGGLASGGGGARRVTLTKNGGTGGPGYIRISAFRDLLQYSKRIS